MTSHSAPRPAPIFVGDHLALDFLNTRSTPSGIWIEWLGDGADLLDWLERAGAIEPAVAARLRSPGDALRGLDGVAEQARSLREWLRAFVQRHAGSELSADVVAELAPLNDLLARDDSYSRVEAGGDDAPNRGGHRQHPLRQQRVRRWTTPEQLLQPIAEAIGDLVCHADFRLIRACEGSACTLMFLDRTKAHARRWCSMAICGNRAKAAAHRARVSGRRGPSATPAP
jgi:predicted RNA-binding Zn ribbon-like protein